MSLYDRFLKSKPTYINPTGKARIYFCCHPKDFDRLFEPISDEILTLRPNAIIYYYDPKEGKPLNLNLTVNLAEMHLFVVAVTSNFIETQNHARTAEFRYAIDNHIPVLPLLQEENIGKRFNEVCGAMQYIDKYALNMDRTAIPYKEKLKKFLDSVLLSDDVVKKVQKAFDTYIFLSYRKKDRRRAKKVMQAIHQSDEMRDVAIWYDEFLTPGENFNNEIIDNIIKSNLMAMVVTPSINETVQNKKNYIMEKEYPAALRYKKPVLPIEAEKTSVTELKENYDGIPDPVNVEEYTRLENKLRRILFPRGQKQNNDPNHRYLIGLAYLSGLFVEVNRQRALNLITSAAEAGVPEAFEKLFFMYWNGEGVERNYSMALEWQRQYVQLLIKQFEKEKTPAVLQKLTDNAYIWGNYSRDAGKLEMAQLAFSQMGIFAKILDDITGQGKTYIANSYCELGNVYYLEGNISEAKKWTETALKIHQSLTSRGTSVGVLNNITADYYKLGMINWKERNFAVAEEYYTKGIEIMERIVKQTDVPEPTLNLVLAYNSLGILFYDQRQLGKAEQYYKNALALLEKYMRKNRTFDCRYILSSVFINLGLISFQVEDYKMAKTMFYKALDILEELIKDSDTIDVRTRLAECYNNIGGAFRREGNRTKAAEFFMKKAAMFESITIETKTPDSYLEYAEACFNTAGTFADKEDYGKAEEWYLKTLNVLDQIKRDDSYEKRGIKGSTLSALGDVYKLSHNTDKAISYYYEALKINKEIVEKLNTPDAKDDLMNTYIGIITLPGVPYEEKKDYLNKVESLSKELLKETNQDKYRVILRQTDEQRMLLSVEKARAESPIRREYKRTAPETSRSARPVRTRNTNYKRNSYYEEAERKINGNNQKNQVKPIYMVILFLVLIILYIILF